MKKKRLFTHLPLLLTFLYTPMAWSKPILNCQSTRIARTYGVFDGPNFMGSYQFKYVKYATGKIIHFSCSRPNQASASNNSPWKVLLNCGEMGQSTVAPSSPNDTFGDFNPTTGSKSAVLRKNGNAYLLSIEDSYQANDPNSDPYFPDSVQKRRVLDVLRCGASQ